MANETAYPFEFIINPLMWKLFGQELENYTIAYHFILEKFDEMRMFRERRIIQDDPEDYWRYIYCGNLGSGEDIIAYIGEIIERFKEFNVLAEKCTHSARNFFKEPENVVSSYFYRDFMCIQLEMEQSRKVYLNNTKIYNEFKETKESPILKELIGEEKYEEVIKPYRPFKYPEAAEQKKKYLERINKNNKK